MLSIKHNLLKRTGFTKLLRFVGAGILLIVFFGATHPAASAKRLYQWEPDKKIPGYPDYTFTPVLVADQNKTVHAFTSQWVGDDERRLAIFYRKWSLAGGWTTPVDIILAPSGDARIQGAFLDNNGIMHMVFVGGQARGTSLYYSYVPAIYADWALAWSEPLAIGGNASDPFSTAISGDDQGNLLVIYNSNSLGNGVYYIKSSDSGQGWTKSVPLFLTNDPSLVPFSLRMVTGQEGQAHATWNVVTSVGGDISLHYARYDRAKAQWTEVLELDKKTRDDTEFFGPSFPSIVDTGENLVVMYNNGNPFIGRPVNTGRPVQMIRVSNDNGKIWSSPSVPFSRHVGRSGEHALVVDSNGVAHAIFTQRIELDEGGKYTLIGGIWHSALRDGNWSEPDRILATLPAHDVRAIVSQGNVLLVVWREDPGAGQDGVWYSYLFLDAPELPVIPLPTPVATISPAGLVPTTTPEIPTKTPLPVDIVSGRPGSDFWGSPAAPLVMTLAVVFLVLIGIVVAYQYNRSAGE